MSVQMEHFVEHAIISLPETTNKKIAHILCIPTVNDLTKAVLDRVKEMRKEKDRSFVVHGGLAHSFGTAIPKTIRRIDDMQKVVISGIMRMIHRKMNDQPHAVINWNFLESSMLNLEMLKTIDDRVYTKTDTFTYGDRPWVRLDGTAEPEFIERAKMWWESFTCDEDIVEDTGIDGDTLVNMIGDMGPRVSAVLTVLSDKSAPLIDDLDFGVIRFPTFEKPYVKISWIRIFIRHEMSRFDPKGNFIRTNFVSRRFVARDEVLTGFKSEIIQLSRIDVNNLIEVYAQ